MKNTVKMQKNNNNKMFYTNKAGFAKRSSYYFGNFEHFDTEFSL